MAWDAQQGDRKVAWLNEPIPSTSGSITACSTDKYEKGDRLDRPFPMPIKRPISFAMSDGP